MILKSCFRSSIIIDKIMHHVTWFASVLHGGSSFKPTYLGVGFKKLLFSSFFLGKIPILTNIFQMG